MTYRITYTVNTPPPDLPHWATVEKISALPLEFPEEGNLDVVRALLLDKSGNDAFLAYFQIGNRGRQLTADQTRQVRDALNELLGETAPEWDGLSEPPANVRTVKDRERDLWDRIEGGWVLRRMGGEALPWNDGVGPGHFSPLTDATGK